MKAAEVMACWLKRMSGPGRWIIATVFGLAGCVWALLWGSLPYLQGEQLEDGLRYPVAIARDAQGVPTLSGQSREDLAFATGYAHAQDRFFQMDLLRRRSAGELAELLGKEAVDMDAVSRFHRFRSRAEQVFAGLPAASRQLLQQYAQGVNAGLKALSVRPFEYLVLGQAPREWSPQDSLFVVWSMYQELQDNQEGRELGRGWLRDHLKADQLAFLLPERTRFDAPLDTALAQTSALASIPGSGPSWLGRTSDDINLQYAVGHRSSVGSNSWAVSGARSAHGGAILADDMHLNLGLAHIWYRAAFHYPDQGVMQSITGITLPGVPNMIVGSNTHVAWGFTNSYGDYVDLVELPVMSTEPLEFDLNSHRERPQIFEEMIAVRGEAPRVIRIMETSLGPVRKVEGRYYAVRWIAHEPFAVNFAMQQLETCDSVEQALSIAQQAGIPAQNFIAVDRQGAIGWTIAGPLPDRSAGLETSFPLPVNSPLLWTGRLSADQYPVLVNPSSGQLWSANSRQLAGEDYAKIGDGGADLGARAQQIKTGLSALSKATEMDLYRIGLDDRALYLSQWRERALALLTDDAVREFPARAEFRRLLNESWDGHASVGSVGYQLARSFYYQLYLELFTGLDEQLSQVAQTADFELVNPRWPAVVEQLLSEQPPHWLPDGQTWRSLQLRAIDQVTAKLTASGDSLEQATWGRRNTLQVKHPLHDALPWLGHWLSAPHDQVPGDDHMPRVSGPAFGQSERMVVSPGREAEGIFNMPGGQSGHPLSPFFLAGHQEWVDAKPRPFLPGAPVYRLTLTPKAS